MDAERRRELERAYRATTYVAGPLRLRIGEPDRRLDALLRERGADAWAYMTAYNPGSRPRPRHENEAAQEALRARLAGRHVVDGASESDDGSWPPEPSLLVVGIARAEAEALGRAFGQDAILVGFVGGAPELAWLDPGF